MLVSVDVEQLIRLFHDTFFARFNTRLLGGADEPLYLPANHTGGGEPCGYHRLYFRADYISSAFHEIAHWCIAGGDRRQQVDFGYWYQPDGRDKTQQRKFEQVEIKPQALEWHFSTAAGHRFNLSADNLSGAPKDSSEFALAVCRQAQAYCLDMPPRARLFVNTLQAFYQTGDTLSPARYQPHRLTEFAQ